MRTVLPHAASAHATRQEAKALDSMRGAYSKRRTEALLAERTEQHRRIRPARELEAHRAGEVRGAVAREVVVAWRRHRPVARGDDEGAVKVLCWRG